MVTGGGYSSSRRENGRKLFVVESIISETGGRLAGAKLPVHRKISSDQGVGGPCRAKCLKKVISPARREPILVEGLG
jgi:hypothetical protein